MDQKLTKYTKMWKGNDNTTTLLFCLKILEIVHQERRQVNTMVMEHFKNILFHKPCYQAAYQSINQSIICTNSKYSAHIPKTTSNLDTCRVHVLTSPVTCAECIIIHSDNLFTSQKLYRLYMQTIQWFMKALCVYDPSPKKI